MNTWLVYLNGKLIDKVQYVDCQQYRYPVDVKRSLVEHDGYDPNIRVRKEVNG